MRAQTRPDASAIVAAMGRVARDGIGVARHLRRDVYEVRAESIDQSYRILFALEGRRILLALVVFSKKTARTPPEVIDLAERRLADWRARAGRRQYH